MIPMVPRNTFGMNSDYTLYPKCNIVDRITFSAGLNGTGKIYWDESNSLSQKFYLLLNAKVIVSSGKFNWEIWGKNLTNEDYLLGGVDFGSLGFSTVGYAEPRTWGIDLRMGF